MDAVGVEHSDFFVLEPDACGLEADSNSLSFLNLKYHYSNGEQPSNTTTPRQRSTYNNVGSIVACLPQLWDELCEFSSVC